MGIQLQLLISGLGFFLIVESLRLSYYSNRNSFRLFDSALGGPYKGSYYRYYILLFLLQLRLFS